MVILLLPGCVAFEENQKTSIKPDSYLIEKGVLIGEITVGEGHILRRDIIPQLSRVFGLTQDEVKQALFEAGQETNYNINAQGYRSFEGVILPGKYQIYEGNSLRAFLGERLKDFEKAIQSTSAGVKVKNNLSIKQQIVLASIVQAECLKGEYLSETSTVFQNRIIAGSKLQSCVTTEYALEYQRSFLTGEDVKVEDPYNTYYAKALPPGPICSFSLESLKAAMNNKMDSDIYYFYYDYLQHEMHFYSNYALFSNDASKARDEFIQQSKIGPRDKINKQALYHK